MDAMIPKKIIQTIILIIFPMGNSFAMISRAASGIKPSTIQPKSQSVHQQRKNLSSFRQSKIPQPKFHPTTNAVRNTQHKESSTSFLKNPFVMVTALKRYFSSTPKKETTSFDDVPSINNMEQAGETNEFNMHNYPSDSNTDLHNAVLSGDLAKCQKLIESAKEESLNNLRAKFLIFLGKQPTWLKKNNEGKTAFYLAVESGNVDLIMLFLNHGALLQNNRTNSPSDLVNSAISDMTTKLSPDSNKENVKAILIEHNIITPESLVEAVPPREEGYRTTTTVADASSNASLIETIKANNIKEIKNQLALGVDLLTKNEKGLRPIDYIAMMDNDEIVNEIIRQRYKLPFCKNKQKSESVNSSANQKAQHTPKFQIQKPNSFTKNQKTKILTNLFSQLINMAAAHGYGAFALDIDNKTELLAFLSNIDKQDDESIKRNEIAQAINQEEEALLQSANSESGDVKNKIDQAYSAALKAAKQMALKEALKALCSAMGLEYAAGLGSHLPKIGNMPERPLKEKESEESNQDTQLEGEKSS